MRQIRTLNPNPRKPHALSRPPMLHSHEETQMTTAIDTIDDVIRILRERPEVRDAVRREILTDDILELPARFAEMSKTVQEILATQLEILNTLKSQAATLEEQGALLNRHAAILERHSVTLDRHSATLDKHTATLDKHTETLDRHTETLDGHTETLDGHTATLDRHSATLDRHTATLDRHTATLDRHTATLDGHTATLDRHTATLDGHTETLDRHTETLDRHTETLDRHTETLDGHGEDIDQLKRDVGELKGRAAYQTAQERHTRIAREMGLRATRLLTLDEIDDMASHEAAAEYSPSQLNSFKDCDLIIAASHPDRGDCYIAVQVASVVDHGDIRRAIDHAGMAARFTGKPAFPAVAGLEAAAIAETRLASDAIHWHRIPSRHIQSR